MKTASATARDSKKNVRVAASKARPEPISQLKSRALYISVGVLLAAVLICYANALGNGFVFDDQNHVLKNKLLRSIENIPRFVTSSYRPIRDISYALDFTLWGEGAFGFHLTNVLIHAVNTLLVFSLIRHFTGQVLTATLAALIFATHPIQTDAVTYISGRRDILFSMFYLASFYSYLHYRRSRSMIFLGLFLVFWALGLMSKEMAASLPLFILAWNFCQFWGEANGPVWARFSRSVWAAFKRDKWLYITVAMAVPAYAYYMVFIKGGSTRAGAAGFNYWGGSFFTNLLTTLCVHAWYLKQLVLPTPIVQYLGAFEIATTLADPRVIVSIIVVAGAFASSFFLITKERLMAFAILSYFVLLLPVSHIIPHHELLADHYLYLPMMSFGLIVSLGAAKLAARGERVKRVAYGVAAALVITFSVMTILRNGVWKDNFTLWQANYREVPQSIRAVSSLAGMYANRNPNKAEELYKRCIEIDPAYSPAYVSLAILMQSREKARELEPIIRQGLALPDSRVISPGIEHPREFRSQLTTALAVCKGNQGDNQTAEQLLWEAINLYPSNPQPYALLATYYRGKDRAKELEVLNRQLAINPFAYDTLTAISYTLIEDKKYDEAIAYLERALSAAPDDHYANLQLGHIYRTKQECSRAQAHLTVAQSAASNGEEDKAAKDALAMLQQQCGK